MRITRTQLAITIGIILLLVVFLTRDVLRRIHTPVGTVVSNTAAALTYTIPPSYQTDTVSEAETKIGMVAKLVRTDPVAQIGIRIDPNMPLEAGIAQLKLADYQQQNIAELYRQYPSFQQVYTGPSTLLGQSGNELLFTYVGLDKITTMQVDIISATINNKPYFFEFQTLRRDYDTQKVDWESFIKSLHLL